MVPIYAVDSFVSLRFKEAALYVDMLRDCYEGYALYLFLALMVGYLGDGDEYKVGGGWVGGLRILTPKERVPRMWGIMT